MNDCDRCEASRAAGGEYYCKRCSAKVERISTSGFTRDGWTIVKKMHDLLRDIDAFVSTHDDDCRCFFCKTCPRDAMHAAADLRGVAWAIEVAESAVSCGLYPRPGDLSETKYPAETDDGDEATVAFAGS